MMHRRHPFLRSLAVWAGMLGLYANAYAQPYDPVCNAVPLTCGSSYVGSTLNATNAGTGENSTCGVAQTRPGSGSPLRARASRWR